MTISGTGFNNVSAVAFGSTPATSFLVNSLDSITAVAPAGTGTQDITVTSNLGTSPVVTADQYAYNGTLAAAAGTASYSNSPGTDVPVTATSQTGSVVTVSAIGAWTVGTEVVLSGFTNGLTAGTYTIASAPALGSFTVSFGGTTTHSGTGTVLLPNTATPSPITATAQTGSVVTLTSVGTWYQGEQLYLTGFTNGLTTGNYAVTGGGNGTFTVTFGGTTTGTGTGTAVPYQVQSFNAATLVTGGTTLGGRHRDEPARLRPDRRRGHPTPLYACSGHADQLHRRHDDQLAADGDHHRHADRHDPVLRDPADVHLHHRDHVLPGVRNRLLRGQPAERCRHDRLRRPGHRRRRAALECHPCAGLDLHDDHRPPSTVLPSTNSGFTVTGIGGYQAITPVPSGISLVPGSLTVSGGDTSSTGNYTVTYCTAAMGYVAGTCTANNATNFITPYPYLETSLNVGSLIAGGSQLSLPTITADLDGGPMRPAGTVLHSTETEFAVVTVVQTIGTLVLDAYPTDLASDLNQGLNAPVPIYARHPAAGRPRWRPAGHSPDDHLGERHHVHRRARRIVHRDAPEVRRRRSP